MEHRNNPHRDNELRRGQAAHRFEIGPQSVRAARIETHARRARSPEPWAKQPLDDRLAYGFAPGGDERRRTAQGPLVNDLPRPRPPSPEHTPEAHPYSLYNTWWPNSPGDVTRNVNYHREHNQWPWEVKPTVPLNFNPFS